MMSYTDQALALRTMVEAFCKLHPAPHLAHVVLEEFNLSDRMIRYDLDGDLRKSFEQCKEYDQLTDADYTQVEAFLKFLLTVPAEIRERLEDEEYP